MLCNSLAGVVEGNAQRDVRVRGLCAMMDKVAAHSNALAASGESECDLALPRWVHTPGETEPDNEMLSRVTALVPDRFDQFVPHDHPALRYALALNDAGFFWEAHEVLEAVWKAAPKGGRDRILLRACIQIANARLKQRLDRPRAVARLLDDARAELVELERRKASPSYLNSFAERFGMPDMNKNASFENLRLDCI